MSGERSARILIYAPSFYPAIEAGGPARDLTNLVDRIQEKHSVVVIAPDRDLSGVPFIDLGPGTRMRGRAVIHYVNPYEPTELMRMVRLAQSGAPDITLINSVWNWRFSLAPALMRAKAAHRPGLLVLMPRGELEAGALGLKPLKKRMSMPCVRALYRRSVSVCAVTSESEARNVSAWNPDLPWIRVSETPDTIPYGAPRSSSEVTRLLFLGRIHPTKGLLELLTAMIGTTNPMRLVVAGPVADRKYWLKCTSVARLLPRSAEVRFIGSATRPEVVDLLHEHDVLVCLTAGENFGHAFAEALQAGCPILATPPTPWTATLRAGGGWVVSNRDDAGAVAKTLDAIAQSTRDEHLARRRSARRAYEEWSRDEPPHVIDQVLAWDEARIH